MVLTLIFWILAGSGLLWILLFNVVGVAWAFSVAKKLIFGKKKEVKNSQES